MILDIILLVGVCYLLYSGYMWKRRAEAYDEDIFWLKQSAEAQKTELNDLKNINRSLWSITNERAGTKTEAGRVEPRANKATPGIGKGVKRKK